MQIGGHRLHRAADRLRRSRGRRERKEHLGGSSDGGRAEANVGAVRGEHDHNWKQIRGTFPDRPLHLFGPDTESGTFDYFTQAVVGTQRASRTDYTSNKNDALLARGVADDEHALAYFGVAYLREQRHLRAVPVDDGNAINGAGPVAPSAETVTKGTYQPLSRPIFIYVNSMAINRPEVDRFVTFCLSAVRELSAEVGTTRCRCRRRSSQRTATRRAEQERCSRAKCRASA